MNKDKLILYKLFESFSEEEQDDVLKLPLFEMAISRKEYKDKIFDRIDQIVENWALVFWCVYFEENVNKQHWLKELKAQLKYIQRLNPGLSKPGKIKALNEVFLDKADLKDVTEIEYIFISKFSEENIKVSNIISNIIAEIFLENIDGLFEVLSERNWNNLEAYCDWLSQKQDSIDEEIKYLLN